MIKNGCEENVSYGKKAFAENAGKKERVEMNKKLLLFAACLLIASSFILLPFPASTLVMARLKAAMHPSAAAGFALVVLAIAFTLGILCFWLKEKKGKNELMSVKINGGAETKQEGDLDA